MYDRAFFCLVLAIVVRWDTDSKVGTKKPTLRSARWVLNSRVGLLLSADAETHVADNVHGVTEFLALSSEEFFDAYLVVLNECLVDEARL